MAISDIYTTRSAIGSGGLTTAVPLLSLCGVATKRLWLVGVRMEVQSAGATPAGQQVLFQLARSGNTPTGTTAATINPQDTGAPASLATAWTVWTTTAPTVGLILGEWTLPQTSGSAWEEFPPLGYEWGVPAIANGSASCGVNMFATASQNVTTSYVVEFIWSE